METNNEVNANVIETEEEDNEVDETEVNETSEKKKLVKSDRRLALDALLAAQAKRNNRTIAAQATFNLLAQEARELKFQGGVGKYIAAFDETYPRKTRSEWDAKLAELDAAVAEAEKTENALLIKFAMATREKEIKRHETSVTNAANVKKNKIARKASEVVTKKLYEVAPEYAIA